LLKPQWFCSILKKHGLSFFTGVPDSLLKYLCEYITDNNPDNNITVANEGAAIGLAAGYHLATKKAAVVYMQNSGTGNAINPLLSLADPYVYSIPMLLVIGWRGRLGTKDEPQHKKQGKIQEDLIKTLGYKYCILDTDSDSAEKQISSLVSEMSLNQTPVVLMIKENTFDKYQSIETTSPVFEMNREDALKIILNYMDSEDRVVATTGKTSREIYEIRESAGQNHSYDFLTVDSMGHALMIAMGISNFQNKKVFCIDGDGALLMHMGSFGIAAQFGSENLYHILINNGVHDSVGGQPTIGFKIPFHDIANKSGYKFSIKVKTVEELKTAIQKLKIQKGPAFLEILVKKGSRPDLGRPKTSPVENKIDFMNNL